MNERAEVRISGKVQGVWYRASAAREAEERGLHGWVRNADDGSVEACVEGPRAQIEDFLTWCRKGPPAARVDAVQATWAAATGEFHSFSIRR